MKLRLMTIWPVLLLLVCSAAGLAASAQAAPAPAPASDHPNRMPPPVKQGSAIQWGTYRMGDSPVGANGIFEWTKPGVSNTWSHMPISKEDLAVRTEFAWFTGRIPTGADRQMVRDPYILFMNASYEFEVYSGTKLLYRQGGMQEGTNPLRANKPVFVSLGEASPDLPLLLRVHSNRDNYIHGKIGPVKYGVQADLKLALIKSDALNGFGAIVFFMIGFAALLMYFIHRDHPPLLYFALFSLMVSFNILLSSHSLMIFTDFSPIEIYLQDPLRGCMLYLFALYFNSILQPVFARAVRTIGIVMPVAGLLMSAANLTVPGIIGMYSHEILIVKELGFSLLCAFCLFVIAMSLRSRINSEAVWFISGFSLFLLINMIGYPLRVYMENDPNTELFGYTPLEFIQFMRLCLDYTLLFSTIFFAVILFKGYAAIYRTTQSNNLKLTNWNQSLEAEVKERTRSIQNLLDYAGQGFLTFDKRLIVQEEYSIECRRLFGKEIADSRYTELLYPVDETERDLHEELLDSVFHGVDDLQREVCLSLLPGEAEVSDRRVSLQYKWIPPEDSTVGKVMVILTDITERRRLESQMAKERHVLNRVVWVVKHYRDFKEMVEEYRAFARKGRYELMSLPTSSEEKWAELSRIVHTFKGNFAQIDFTHTMERLHELETELVEWKTQAALRTPHAFSSTSLAEWLDGFDLLEWLEEDLRILRGILGDGFDAGQETVTIEISRLRHLEQQVYTLLPGSSAQRIVSELKKLQYRPFRELLSMYPDYSMKLAHRTGKEIHPIEIRGGELLVDPERYIDFTRTLIHVFRNMIDHGIETPEYRTGIGKDRSGTLLCELSNDEQEIRIRLSNDGKEMNLPQIGTQAVTRGFCTQEEFDAWPPATQLMMIFREGFTTGKAVNELSGRGIGLFAVVSALESLNGKVHVESSAENGTSFTFMLPRQD